MTGDENDLLSESPLFERSNQSDTGRRVDRPPANLVDDAEEIDPALIKEIEIYI
jgi:hypothetical protein